MHLAEEGVKVLAIDFDLTLSSMHTGGKWWGTAETLARSVRPIFKVIIPAALELGIEVCVVTFSAQTKLISNVLEMSLPCDAAQIRIRGGEKKKLVNEDGELDTQIEEGQRKQRHINSMLRARAARGEGPVLPHELVLSLIHI